METNYKTYVLHDDNTVHIFNAIQQLKDGNTVTYTYQFEKEVAASEIEPSILKDCIENGYTAR